MFLYIYGARAAMLRRLHHSKGGEEGDDDDDDDCGAHVHFHFIDSFILYAMHTHARIPFRMSRTKSTHIHDVFSP